MDKHYLTPLFTPQSIVVLAGDAARPEALTPQARTLHQALRAQRFQGTLTFVDVHRSGTLAELAQAKADLALIALPPDEVGGALALAGRIGCQAALVLSAGITAVQCGELQRIARAEGAELRLLPREGGGLVARVSWI